MVESIQNPLYPSSETTTAPLIMSLDGFPWGIPKEWIDASPLTTCRHVDYIEILMIVVLVLACKEFLKKVDIFYGENSSALLQF